MQIQMRAFVPASIGPWVNAWRASLNDWANSYQPEKHYMRGPGPKWREKHLKAVMPPTLGRLLALDESADTGRHRGEHLSPISIGS